MENYYYYTRYRTWSEEGNYMGMFKMFSEAKRKVLEFGGVVVDSNNEIVLSVPEILKEDEIIMRKISESNEWSWR